MGIVRDLARHGKDRAISKALEVLGERIISRYGKLLGFSLDSNTRRIDMEVLLKGENEPITLTVHEYRFTFEEGRTCVVIENVTVSREWIHLLAEDLLEGKPFEIPPKYARILDALV